jgi:Leucine-rich repeat (LRR) protein
MELWSSLPNDVIARIILLAPANVLCTIALLDLESSAHTRRRLLALEPLTRLPFYRRANCILGINAEEGWLHYTLFRSLGLDDCTTLSTAFIAGAFPFLTSLRLISNGIGDAGLVILAGAFARGAVPELTSLDVLDNRIGDAGIGAFASACENGALPKLETLSFSNNGIGDAGIGAFASACKNGAFPKLEKLSFSNNRRMSVGGAEPLVLAFKHGALPKLMGLSFGGIICYFER